MIHKSVKVEMKTLFKWNNLTGFLTTQTPNPIDNVQLYLMSAIQVVFIVFKCLLTFRKRGFANFELMET